MPLSYGQLQDQNGTIVNTATGYKYGAGQTPQQAQAQLASDLGIRPDEIDWTQIAKAGATPAATPAPAPVQTQASPSASPIPDPLNPGGIKTISPLPTPPANTIQPVIPAKTIPAPSGPPATQQSTYANAAGYAGPSIVDFLSQAGQPSDFNSRTALATKYGIQGYTGSATQNTQLLGILRSVASGNVNSTGVPNNIGKVMGASTVMPSPDKPMDINNVTDASGNIDISKILGAGAGASTTGSDIAGLLSLYGASSAESKNYDALTTELTTAMKSLGNEGADLQAAMDANGVGDAYQHVKELNLQAAQLKGQLDTFDAETEQGKAKIEDQAIPTGLISGQQAQLQKQRDLTRLAKAAELSGVLALSQAYQGNITIGTDLAQKSVDMKYAPILNEIDVLKTQLNIAGDKMNKADAARAKVIDSLLNIKTAEINTEKKTQSDIQTLAVQAASNGAPLPLVKQMQAAADPAAAASIGAAYLKGNLETPIKNTNGVTTTFTSGQENNGAQNAGLPIAEFKGLPGDVQNFFVSAPPNFIGAFNDAISKAQAGQPVEYTDNSDKAHPVQVSYEQLIQDSNAPESVKQYLIQRIHSATKAPASTSSNGGILSSIGSAFGNIWNYLTGQ